MALAQFAGNRPVSGQPLIADGLTVYYDFDSFTNQVVDRSGNGLSGAVELSFNGVNNDAFLDGLPDVRRTFDSVRGVGAALFDTNVQLPEDHISICTPGGTTTVRDCAVISNSLIPTDSFSVAAWIKVQQAFADQTLLEFRGNGLPSTIGVDASGRLDVTLAGADENATLFSQAVYTDGSTDNAAFAVPFDEWFHVAVTYSQDTGHYAVYFNGQIATDGNRRDGGTGAVAGWDGGVSLGLSLDGAGQWVGNVDEFYIYRRVLSAADVAQLAELIGPPAPGDFNDNSELDGIDIESLSAAIRLGVNDPVFDLDADSAVDDADRYVWVHDLKRTYFGDANLDGSFDSGDLIDVFIAGEYEDALPGNSAWWEGDWTGDGEFDTSDIILAFVDGGYDQGPRAAGGIVPEPAASALVLAALIALPRLRTSRRRVPRC